MKKSLVSLLLLVVMMCNIFAMFTSCFGGGGGYEELDLTGEYDGSSVTISFWHSMGAENKALLDSAIA